MISRRLASHAALVAAALLPALGLAHSGGDAGAHHAAAAAACLVGFAHPFTGLDHLAALVALGVWSALTARRVWLAPLVFAATLGFGAWLGVAGLALPMVEPMIAASLLVLGLLLATRARLPALAGAAIAAMFALFHGVAHGQELAGDDAWSALAGMVLATALLHVGGIALGMLLRDRNLWLPRVAGIAVSATGAVLFGQFA